jgi:O-antigen/teichoic acid export membrane protein
MGVCTGGLSLENTSLALFSARQRMKPVAAVGAVKFVTEVAVTVAVLLAGATALGLTVSRAIVTGLAVLAGIVLARRLLGARLAVPSAAAVRPLLVAGLSFAAITTLWPIQARAGVLMLGHVHGLEAVALFSAAMLPVERLFSFFPAIQDACFPLFSALGRDDTARFPSALAKSLRYQALLAAGLGLGVSLAGPWALRVVFPPGLHAAGAVLEILGLAVGLRALGVLLTTATLARGLERAVVKATALQCAVTVAAAAALVGPLGAVGLGWATVVCEATGVGALAWVLWRRGLIGARPLASLAAPAAAGVALFLGFTQVPSGRDGLLVPLAFAASYPVVLVLSRALSRDDLGYVRALLAGQGRARSS